MYEFHWMRAHGAVSRASHAGSASPREVPSMASDRSTFPFALSNHEAKVYPRLDRNRSMLIMEWRM